MWFRRWKKKRNKLAFWLFSSVLGEREWIASESEWYVVTYLNCTVYTNPRIKYRLGMYKCCREI